MCSIGRNPSKPVKHTTRVCCKIAQQTLKLCNQLHPADIGVLDALYRTMLPKYALYREIATALRPRNDSGSGYMVA